MVLDVSKEVLEGNGGEPFLFFTVDHREDLCGLKVTDHFWLVSLVSLLFFGSTPLFQITRTLSVSSPVAGNTRPFTLGRDKIEYQTQHATSCSCCTGQYAKIRL